MITVNKENVHLKGNMPELLTEVTVACRALKETMAEDGLSEEQAKEQLQRCVDLAFMRQEELDMEVQKAVAKMILGRLMGE